MTIRALFVAILVFLGTSTVLSQTTEFRYQGRLSDGSIPATGSYDMRFTLFSTLTGVPGSEVGSPLEIPGVQVSDGIFTVTLNFPGSSSFSGPDRYRCRM
ncbi:hypothetical protein BH24ACI3_BH24ACI3_04890 [soil metagenome]